MNNEFSSLNIQPEASILSVFSRLNYKVWYAIAEFVDNSTQSFYSNEITLGENGIEEVNIHIDYDSVNKILTIRDDAYGMEKEDFIRAIRLDSPPNQQGGRNEFGMGLKTAASWFGNYWSVETTQYNSDNKYYAEIDINKLKEEKLNSIVIRTSKTSIHSHGTIITIKDITKNMSSATTKTKIVELLSSMYRRDLNSGKVNIFFNGQPLKFNEYNCLNFREQTWKKELDFSFSFDDKTYRVTGFVGILDPGSYNKAGFALFRRDRVIIGGEGQNYKPNPIFIQAQSQVALKLFGELNLEDFPINQAKDGFYWDDGLEEIFIQALKDEIRDYISIAKMSIQERTRETEFSTEVANGVQERVNTCIQRINENNETIDLQIGDLPEVNLNDVDKYKNYLKETNATVEQNVGTTRQYNIRINPILEKTFVVSWTIGNDNYWMTTETDDNNPNKKLINININHPFFKPYSTQEDFKIVLEKFVLAFTLSIEQLLAVSDKNGYVLYTDIEHQLNKNLSDFAEEI